MKRHFNSKALGPQRCSTPTAFHIEARDRRLGGAPWENGLVLSLWIAAALVAPAVADDWPVERGDISGSGVAKSALADDLEIVWRYRADDAGFQATAIIADGIVYVGDDLGTFHAVRLADGKAVWTKNFDDSGFLSGAAIVDDRLFVGDYNGVVRCLAIADGNELWTAEVDGTVYAGPTPHEGAVLVTSEAGTLNSFDLATGEENWEFSIDSPLRCSPTIANGRVTLAGCDSKLYVIDAETGNEVGVVEIDAPTGCTAAVHDDKVYFGTYGGTFYVIDVSADDGEPRIVDSFRDDRRGQEIRSAAAVNDRLAVYGSHARAVFAIDPASVEPKWIQPTRTRVESSPVLAGERVVVATVRGVLHLLDVADGGEKWQFEAGGGFTASPAVVDGRLIIGNTDGTLYCFGTMDNQPAQEFTEGGGSD